jgi:ubiquinone/menaquinone biosynthesis C-methylase UbiE
MGEVNILELYPKACRDLAARKAGQAANRLVAKRFGFEYFDGTREQGYGGYRYDGRWIPIARRIVDHFGLRPGDRVLDIGCAKGYLVKDMMDVCPGLQAFGLDISGYALEHAHADVQGRLVRGTVDALPFADRQFAAVLAINVIHNLDRNRCLRAIREIERVAPGRGYIQVDAYRDETELGLFLDWVLTAETYGPPHFWRDMFAEAGYSGDYYWTIIEADSDPAAPAKDRR